MARRSPDHAAHTRSALLDAALTVFAERGFAAAQLEDIARRAHVTRGALYHHFTGKPALFQAVLGERWDTVMAPATDELTPKPAETRSQIGVAVDGGKPSVDQSPSRVTRPSSAPPRPSSPPAPASWPAPTDQPTPPAAPKPTLGQKLGWQPPRDPRSSEAPTSVRPPASEPRASVGPPDRSPLAPPPFPYPPESTRTSPHHSDDRPTGAPAAEPAPRTAEKPTEKNPLKAAHPSRWVEGAPDGRERRVHKQVRAFVSTFLHLVEVDPRARALLRMLLSGDHLLEEIVGQPSAGPPGSTLPWVDPLGAWERALADLLSEGGRDPRGAERAHALLAGLLGHAVWISLRGTGESSVVALADVLSEAAIRPTSPPS